MVVDNSRLVFSRVTMMMTSLSAKEAGTVLRHVVSRRYLSASSEFSQKVKAGAGYGNVKDRMIPTVKNRSHLYKHSATPHTCTILGAPMTYGQPYVGTDSAPTLLREAGLRGMLTSLGWRVEDLPDLDFETLESGPENPNYHGNARNHGLVGAGNKLLADLVTEKLRQKRFPLILGGDHSIGIGSLAGILRVQPDTGVIWVDAHADLNTPDISESGNMHGSKSKTII